MMLNIPLRKGPKLSKTLYGEVTAIKAPIISVRTPHSYLGQKCKIALASSSRGEDDVLCKVVGFNENCALLTAFGEITKIAKGQKVIFYDSLFSIPVGNELLGRIIDPLGNILDEQGYMSLSTTKDIFSKSESFNNREIINTRFSSGVLALDFLYPIGKGQRVCIVAPPGAGKTTLLSMIAKNCEADVIVVALVGERGREVSDFISEALPKDQREKSVVIVATSDAAPLARMLAPYSATSIAESFKEQGKDVLLIVDSITRTARAMREVGISAGEVPLKGGYPASVFGELPKLFEKTGNFKTGSITAFYSLLIENDEVEDLLASEVKSLLDGHITLSSKIASRGMRPAIDVSKSLSRLASKFGSKEEQNLRERIISRFTRLEQERDMLALMTSPPNELLKAKEIEEKFYEIFSQSLKDRKKEAAKDFKEILEIANY